MKMRLNILCLVLAIVMCLSGCVVEIAPSDDTNSQTTPQAELNNIATYDNMQLELKDATAYTTDDGKTMLKVHAVYTNNSAEPLYALCSFAVKAFQNDIAITDSSDINGDEASLIKEVKNGKSVEVDYVFELTGDSDVEVLICEPTAEQKTIGRHIYSVSEK